MSDQARPEAEYRYDPGLDALVVAVFGPRSYEQARSHFAKVIDRLQEAETNRLLLDLTEADYDFTVDEAIEAFAKIAEVSQGNQVALIMKLSKREQGIILQTLGTMRWNLVRLFHDREAAEAWLRETAD